MFDFNSMFSFELNFGTPYILYVLLLDYVSTFILFKYFNIPRRHSIHFTCPQPIS